MSKTQFFGGWILATGVFAALVQNVIAADTYSSPPFMDPAFESHLRSHDLGEAWRKLDAEALTDSALQLLEGERILLRSHRGLSADTVAILAAKLAIAKNQTAQLLRLESAFQGRSDVAAALATIKKLGSENRGTRKPAEVSLDDHPQTIAILRCFSNAALRAQLTGESRYFTLSDSDQPNLDRILQNLPPARRKDLEMFMQEARSLPAAKVADQAGSVPAGTDPTLATLDMLAQSSRPWEHDSSGAGYQFGNVRIGIESIQNPDPTPIREERGNTTIITPPTSSGFGASFRF